MPTSFEALHEETRPLALLDEGRPTPPPGGWRQQLTITGAGLTVVGVVLLVLL